MHNTPFFTVSSSRVLLFCSLLALVGLFSNCSSGDPACDKGCTAAEEKCDGKDAMLCLHVPSLGCKTLVKTPCGAGTACKRVDGKVQCAKGDGKCGSKKQAEKRCVGQDVHWFDDCGKQQDKIETCPTDKPCTSGVCKATTPNCPNACTVGKQQCNGNSVVTCQEDPTTKCPTWGNPSPCLAGTTCQNSRCQKGCKNVCTAGQKRCSGNGFQVCTVDNTSKCTLWGTATPCAKVQTCSNGQCAQSCQNACKQGESRCDNNAVQSCQKDTNGCTAWQTVQKCSNSQSCQNSKCVAGCKNVCSNGQKRCSGSSVQVCYKASNGCYGWKTNNQCTGNSACKNGQCVTSCKNPCSSGQQRCSGTNIQTCQKASDGCLGWSAPRACPRGQKCSNNKCSNTCSNQCTAGSKRCNGNAIQTCVKGSNGCTQWGGNQACPSGQKCSNNKCSSTCSNQCTAGSKRCSGNAIQTCTKGSNGCTQWTGNQACPSGQVCNGAKCEKPTNPSQRTKQIVCTRWNKDFPKKTAPNWTGTGCTPGTISQGSIDDAVRRVNLYRWLVGGLGTVTEYKTYSQQAQACAVIQANGDPSSAGHHPKSTAKCYNSTGATASGRSNLSWGVPSPADAVTQFIADRNVASLGHRLWNLSPGLGRTGFGYAKGTGRYRQGSCQYVFDRTGRGNPKFIAYPPPGPVPMAAMRTGFGYITTWHFASSTYKVSSLTSVTVTRKSDGNKQTLRTRRIGNYGSPPGVSFTPRTPKAGETYTVQLGTIYSYTISFVDCTKP